MAEEILAPMSGKVINIDLGPGEKVKEDDVVITLEAMKMEVEVCSPSDGTIGSIEVEIGGLVGKDAILATITE